jgi:hypothetical protein
MMPEDTQQVVHCFERHGFGRLSIMHRTLTDERVLSLHVVELDT